VVHEKVRGVRRPHTRAQVRKKDAFYKTKEEQIESNDEKGRWRSLLYCLCLCFVACGVDVE